MEVGSKLRRVCYRTNIVLGAKGFQVLRVLVGLSNNNRYNKAPTYTQHDVRSKYASMYYNKGESSAGSIVIFAEHSFERATICVLDFSAPSLM